MHDSRPPRTRTAPDIADPVAYPKPQTAGDAVRNGMKLLDRAEPGWRDRVDLAAFQISSTSDCILGQVYAREPRHDGEENGFETGCRILDFGGSQRVAGEFGFTGYSRLITLPTLQAAWQEALAA